VVDGWPGVTWQEDIGRWLFECPEPRCWWRLLIKHEHDTEHTCPHEGQVTYGWSETVKLVSQIWEMLDKCIDDVKNPEVNEAQRAVAGNQARAYCNTLVLFMTPIFSTSNDVAKEAMARWRARRDGVEHHTPGMMHATYKTVLDGDVWYEGTDGFTSDPAFASGAPRINNETVKNRMKGALDAAASQSGAEATRLHWEKQGKPHMGRPRQPELPVAHNLDDKQVAVVKQFAAAGASHDELAKMFSVSAAQIASIVSI
jgi:hypothetical protein